MVTAPPVRPGGRPHPSALYMMSFRAQGRLPLTGIAWWRFVCGPRSGARPPWVPDRSPARRDARTPVVVVVCVRPRSAARPPWVPDRSPARRVGRTLVVAWREWRDDGLCLGLFRRPNTVGPRSESGKTKEGESEKTTKGEPGKTSRGAGTTSRESVTFLAGCIRRICGESRPFGRHAINRNLTGVRSKVRRGSAIARVAGALCGYNPTHS